MDFLFGKTFDLLSNMLDFRSKRQTVIASNIVNMATPGYKPQDLTFERSLAEVQALPTELELKKTNGKHLPGLRGNGNNYQIITTGDSVDIDREMANLSGNNLMYNLTVELLSRKFKIVNGAIREAR